MHPCKQDPKRDPNIENYPDVDGGDAAAFLGFPGTHLQV